jgi:hypothetical protein
LNCEDIEPSKGDFVSKFLLFFLSVLFCQFSALGSEIQSKSIKDLLNKGIKSCHDKFEGEKPEKYIFDKANAYAHVEGGYPTCGCPCSATSTIFVGRKKEYFQWTYETDRCSQLFKNESNKDIMDLIPSDIAKEFGVPEGQKSTFATFYLQPILPQKGKSVRIGLPVIPVGIKESCNGPVCVSLTGGTFKRKVKWVDYVQSWLNQSQANPIAKKYLEKMEVPKNIPASLLEHGKKMGRNDLKAEAIIDDLEFVKDVYLRSQGIQFDKIDLNWNKKENSFEIRKKIPYKKKSFKEFIKSQEFETPKC